VMRNLACICVYDCRIQQTGKSTIDSGHSVKSVKIKGNVYISIQRPSSGK